MSTEATIEHFGGLLDPADCAPNGIFVEIARIVAGEAKRDSGLFTFCGETRVGDDGKGTIVETKGRYQRDGNIIRVFFDKPAGLLETIALSGA